MADEPLRYRFETDPVPPTPGGIVCMACDCGDPRCLNMRVGLYGGNLMDIPLPEGKGDPKTAIVVSLKAVKAIEVARAILELAQQQIERALRVRT